MRYPFAVVVLVASSLCACGPLKANPCVTRGSTYVVHAVEAAGGTCGGVPDQIVNVDSDGTIGSAGTKVTCDSEEFDGCATRRNGCKTSAAGTNCTSVSTITFAKDGATGSGALTLSCTTASAACVSSYDVTYTRH